MTSSDEATSVSSPPASPLPAAITRRARKIRHHNICLLGSEGSGKSSLLSKYLHRENRMGEEVHDPTIEDTYTHRYTTEDKEFVLNFIDTGGYDYFVNLKQKWLLWGSGFFLVYSTAQRCTFESIEDFYSEVQRLNPHAQVILVGTHVDRESEREVTVEEGKSLAMSMSCPFVETSAKDGLNVDNAFHLMVKKVNHAWKKERRELREKKMSSPTNFSSMRNMRKMEGESPTAKTSTVPKNKFKRYFSSQVLPLLRESRKAKQKTLRTRNTHQLVFGVHLEEVMDRNRDPHSPIPDFVAELFKFLREECLRTEGLFRVSANKEVVEKVMSMANKGIYVNMKQNKDCNAHVASGLLKTWLARLPVPLFTFKLYDDFMAIGASIDHPNTLPKLRRTMKLLPSLHRTVLKALFMFLHDVAQESAHNKMGASNLATVFTPTLLYTRKAHDAMRQVSDLVFSTAVIQACIENHNTVLPDENYNMKVFPSTLGRLSSPGTSPILKRTSSLEEIPFKKSIGRTERSRNLSSCKSLRAVKDSMA